MVSHGFKVVQGVVHPQYFRQTCTLTNLVVKGQYSSTFLEPPLPKPPVVTAKGAPARKDRPPDIWQLMVREGFQCPK